MHRFLLFIAFTAATAGAQVNLGYRLHAHELPRQAEHSCVTSPSQTYVCAADVTLAGTHFSIVSYDSRRQVRYLFTSDPAFTTQTGLRVGDWVEVDERDVLLIPGWHISGPRTADGWRLVFGTDETAAAPPLKYQDGTGVNLVHTLESAPKRGRLKIVGFEKGEV